MTTYLTLGVPSNMEVREMLRQWQAQNRWAWANLSNAMRMWGASNVAGANRLASFAHSRGVTLHDDALRSLRRFLLAFPQPGPFDALVERLEAERVQRAREEQERPIREAMQRERDRAAHVRYWLERERRPRGPRRSDNPLMLLDKATVAALSGGTL